MSILWYFTSLLRTRGNCARLSPLSLPHFSSIVARAHCNLCIGWDHRKAPMKIASLLDRYNIVFFRSFFVRGHSARVVQSHTCLHCSATSVSAGRFPSFVPQDTAHTRIGEQLFCSQICSLIPAEMAWYLRRLAHRYFG